MQHFDILIIGAGPAGISCAIKLAGAGLSVAVFDKSVFPRDKICGDALSADVVNQLSFLSENLLNSFNAFPSKIPIFGVSIFSPDNNLIDIPFIHKSVNKCGYICKRKDFDNILFEELKKMNQVTIFENCNVKDMSYSDYGIRVESTEGIFECKMLVGADGAYSTVARKLSKIKIFPNHYCSGLRMYYENVLSVNEKNYIELYFLKDILPGYLWIFPLPENKANIGIGMLSSEIIKKKINLKNIFMTSIAENPLLKERLKNAIPVETLQGYGLPLGSEKRTISGENFILLGDAAGLIDPFTGEGVANAIRSGRVAAEHLKICFEKNNFTALINQSYDKEIYLRMWSEFRVNRALQKFSKYPGLFNFIVNKANRSNKIKHFLIDAVADVEKKNELINLVSLYKTIFKKNYKKEL